MTLSFLGCSSQLSCLLGDNCPLNAKCDLCRIGIFDYFLGNLFTLKIKNSLGPSKTTLTTWVLTASRSRQQYHGKDSNNPRFLTAENLVIIRSIHHNPQEINLIYFANLDVLKSLGIIAGLNSESI